MSVGFVIATGRDGNDAAYIGPHDGVPENARARQRFRRVRRARQPPCARPAQARARWPTGASAWAATQVIVIGAGRGEVDAVMRIYNADGGEVESCGNATRCVARLLMDEKRPRPRGHRHTGAAARLHRCRQRQRDRRHGRGAPGMERDTAGTCRGHQQFRDSNVGGNDAFAPAAVNVGNPHCVLFEDDADTAPVAQIGPRIETHAMFPARTNVEFVR